MHINAKHPKQSKEAYYREWLRLAKENWQRRFAEMLLEFRMLLVHSLAAACCLLLAQATGDETKPKIKTGTLIIEFDGLANDKGEVLAGLYNEAKKFPKENQALRNLKAKPVNKKCAIKTDKVPFGDYALAVMHDENMSGNMDYNLSCQRKNTVFQITKAPDFLARRTSRRVGL